MTSHSLFLKARKYKPMKVTTGILGTGTPTHSLVGQLMRTGSQEKHFRGHSPASRTGCLSRGTQLCLLLIFPLDAGLGFISLPRISI